MQNNVGKIRTPDDELRDLLTINKEMLKKEGIIYLSDMQHLKTIEFDNAFFTDNGSCGENLLNLYRKKIYSLVAGFQYRAEQRLLYEQLPIFLGLLPLIDEVIENFFSQKYISAYLALVPAVEGLLLRWAQKNKESNNFSFKKFIKNKVIELKQRYSNSTWTKCNLDLLEYIIVDFFFAHSDENYIETMFNRNVVSHLLNDPNYLNSKKNCLRLFTIIDLIAKCYTYDFPLEGGGSIELPYGKILCEKYLADGQDIIKKNMMKYKIISNLAKDKNM